MVGCIIFWESELSLSTTKKILIGKIRWNNGKLTKSKIKINVKN
jgi:hypothetical protein